MKTNFKVTDTQYKVFKFPAGEIQVQITETLVNVGSDVTIVGSVTNSDHIMELLQLNEALSAEGYENIHLIMPYCAYSRQDRRCNIGESLSLKVFTNLINSCKFKTVTTYDNHSDVATALLDNCTNVPVHSILYGEPLLNLRQYDYFISPDAGANKKVFECSKMFNVQMLRADKVRDTRTGKILETQIFADNRHLDNTKLLIIDDICDGGRTFIELAKAIKKVSKLTEIHLFVTHGFFSKGVEPLVEAGISRIITTDSVRDTECPNLDIVELEH